jgi:hypothetical protein
VESVSADECPPVAILSVENLSPSPGSELSWSISTIWFKLSFPCWQPSGRRTFAAGWRCASTRRTRYPRENRIDRG